MQVMFILSCTFLISFIVLSIGMITQNMRVDGNPSSDPSDSSSSSDSNNNASNNSQKRNNDRSATTPSLTPPPPTPPSSNHTTPSQPPTPPSPPNSPPRGSFPLPPDHSPGADGTGTMDVRIRRSMSLYRHPLYFDPQDFKDKFKISKIDFIRWARSCQTLIQRTRELDYLAQALLFLHKMLNNVSFRALSVDFVLPASNVRRIFQYQNNLNVPRLIFNGLTVDEQVSRLLTESCACADSNYLSDI